MIIFALCAIAFSCKDEEPIVQVPEHLVVHDWLVHQATTTYLLTKENDTIQTNSNFKVYKKTLQEIEKTYRNGELRNSYSKTVQITKYTWSIIK